MAASRAANVLQKDHLNISVLFAKLVTPDKLGSLIVEIVKYILYEREQLPMPYDNFRKHVDRIAGTSANKAMLNPAKPIQSANQRKALASLQGMDLVLGAVQTLVDDGRVTSVALLFGSTVVSPVETYVIRVPPRNRTCSYCGDASGFRRCIFQVLEALLGHEQRRKMASTTKLTTFLHLRRENVQCDLMEVRPNFNATPRRGALTSLDLDFEICPHSCRNDANLTGRKVYCIKSIGLGTRNLNGGAEGAGRETATSDEPGQSQNSCPDMTVLQGMKGRHGDCASPDEDLGDWVWAQCKPVFTTVAPTVFSSESSS